MPTTPAPDRSGFSRVAAEIRTRNAWRFIVLRLGASSGWLAICVAFGTFGPRADLRAGVPVLAGYFGVAAGMLVAGRLNAKVLKHSFLAGPVIDLPFLFAAL